TITPSRSSSSRRSKAKKTIAAHTEAAQAGNGVGVGDGRLIENLHGEAARRQVALADAITALAKD
ncbi:MAG: hypothetical protein AAB223_06300, partial [Pseudomonadota bacterium]